MTAAGPKRRHCRWPKLTWSGVMVHGGKPVVVLPGFPTSAILTFHEFAAPVIRAFAGLPALRPEVVDATLPLRIASERGRTEYVMASLMRAEGALMVNRNAGSGTRILIDRVLGGARPPGHSAQTKSHNAVAVAQGRADWGVAIPTVAAEYGLGFLSLQAEQYDFMMPAARLDRAPVQRFLEVLRRPSTRAALRARGFELADD